VPRLGKIQTCSQILDLAENETHNVACCALVSNFF